MKSPSQSCFPLYLWLIAFLGVGFALGCFGQPANTNLLGGTTLLTGTNAPPTEGLLTSIVKALRSVPTEHVTTLLTLVFGAALTWAIAKVRKLKRRLAGPRFALPKAQSERLNRVLLLGIGGTGKTSLIESLTCNSEADPRVKTAEVRTYSLVFEVIGSELSKVCRMDIDDYRGQNLGQLVDVWAKRHEEGEAFPITSVVFVVDLFEPPEPNESQSAAAKWERARVANHISAWSEEAVAAVLGLTQGKHKLICLFINKVDLLIPNGNNTEAEVRKAYEKLINRLADRSAGARLEVLVGSAKTGVKVATLLRLLIEFAQPMD